MTSQSLPETGSIEVVEPEEAVDIVEDVAADAAAGAAAPLLIALDIDGTVLLEDESLSPGIVEAAADAQRAGHEVMLATGRSWEGTRDILRRLELNPEYVVCSNGAVLLKRVGDTVDADVSYTRFHVETFDARDVLELLREHVPHGRYLVELADGRRLYTEFLDDWNLTNADKVSFDELSAQPVCRVVLVSPDDTAHDFLELVTRMGLNEVSYAVGWSAWLDIAPQGVDKSTALERVRTLRGVEPSRVLVVGDGRNDLGMFRWALQHGGRAVAMGQGPEDVRREAGEIIGSVESGGVAELLRRL